MRCMTAQTSHEDMVDGVPVKFRSRDGKYAFINECALIDHIWPNRSYLDRDYIEDGKVLMAWCKKHGATWYSFEKYDFSSLDGIRMAKAEGNTIIVMENLS